MEFDTKRVYTAVNADELKTGDIVAVADTLGKLKFEVERGLELELKEVHTDDYMARFEVVGSDSFGVIAYLVCPARNAEAYHAWKEGKPIEQEDSVWLPYTKDEEPNWCMYHYRPAEAEKPK